MRCQFNANDIDKSRNDIEVLIDIMDVWLFCSFWIMDLLQFLDNGFIATEKIVEDNIFIAQIQLKPICRGLEREVQSNSLINKIKPISFACSINV
eukprot:TRINITY_DN364_c0_g1_i1.p4 TRINITY_DN364_c0_g1~~TRINITY_DN364_c0_g1_i1.p4  ORF type:complete len:108 (-),score=5.07 TRINITY_DN364_c0_g1_i1:767-1051(-)